MADLKLFGLAEQADASFVTGGPNKRVHRTRVPRAGDADR